MTNSNHEVFRAAGGKMTRRGALAALGTLPFSAGAAEPLKILLVVAHPDDEYYFAATTYRLAQELQARVDQVIITNGEGGFRYSARPRKSTGCRSARRARAAADCRRSAAGKFWRPGVFSACGGTIFSIRRTSNSLWTSTRLWSAYGIAVVSADAFMT